MALVADGQVLLVQRARAPSQGLWTLPGGRLEPGEDAKTAAARELREELGLAVKELRPVMRLAVPEANFTLQVFASTQFAGTIRANAEIADWCWIAPEQAAALPTTPGLGPVLTRSLAIAGS